MASELTSPAVAPWQSTAARLLPLRQVALAWLALRRNSRAAFLCGSLSAALLLISLEGIVVCALTVYRVRP